MIYEYDSDLYLFERIAKVANEIHKKYSNISLDEAKKIASITNPINDKVTDNDIFDRLYKIMLIIGKEHPDFSRVFNDSYDVYENGSLDEKYKNVMYEIVKYINGDTSSFPFITE